MVWSPTNARTGALDARDTAGRPAGQREPRERRVRPRWWTEVLVVVWMCWIYDAINNLAPLRKAAAFAHGAAILHLEQVVHLDPEAALDHWLSHEQVFASVISNYYDNAHFVVTFGLVGLLWWKFPALYRPLRTGLVLINILGMAVFWIYPTAPPRLLNPSQFSDVVATSHAIGSWHTGSLATAANQLAAMPSLHLAWATWSAVAAWRILGRRRWSVLLFLYPLLTTFAVLSTGNHFLVDALAGVVTCVVAQLIADRWEGWWTSVQARLALRRQM